MIYAHMSNKVEVHDEDLYYSPGAETESGFEPHFARAPWFLLFDTRDREVDAIRNGFTVSDQKIGQNAVLLLSSHNITTVITWQGRHPGEKSPDECPYPAPYL